MWTKKKIRVKMMYPAMLSDGDGIFTDLQNLDVPWQSMNIQAALNYGYYLNSARKIISPFVFDVSNAEENLHTYPIEIDPLTTVQRTIIAVTVYNMFRQKWDRLWDIYNLEYNPLYNYTVTEEETINVDDSGTVADTGTQRRVIDTDTTNTGTNTVVTDREVSNTGTDTHNISKQVSDGGNESIQKSSTQLNTGTDTTATDTDTTNTGTVQNVGSSDTLDGLFGFNSSTSVGSDTRETDTTGTRTDNLAGTVDTTVTETQNLTETISGTDTRTRALTHTESNTDTNTKNLATDEDATETETKNLAGTVDTTDTRTDNLTRTTEEQSETTRSLSKNGNIGFNTPQEMLVADLELWQWNFFKSVFEDIDSVLTISIY